MLKITFLLAFALAAAPAISSAKENEAKKEVTKEVKKAVKKDKSIAEIKLELESEKDNQKRFHLLTDLVIKYASETLTPQMWKDAQQSAQAALDMSPKFKKNWDYGNAIRHGNLVLGRVNLIKGHVAEAIRHLKLAGETRGSPQLNSFGPNMTLAKELLEKGEKKAVLEYFDMCLRFWEGDSAKQSVDEWKADVAQGKIPSFGSHLKY